MSYVIRERIKFYFLILLIALSLVQIGILWSYQSHGLPFSFLSGKETSVNSNLFEAADKSLFYPYRMIVSSGNDKWLVEEKDENYTRLWSEAKNYLTRILSGNFDKAYSSPRKWREVLDNKGFIFEFKTNIEINLIQKFLNQTVSGQYAPTGIYKMAIIPWETDNDNQCSIYITEGNKLYQYIIDLNSKGLNKNQFMDIIRNNIMSNKSKYRFFRQADSGNQYGFKEDELCVQVNKYRDYSNIITKEPAILKDMAENVDNMADALLGAEKDSFDRSIDANNTLEFKTQNRNYKLYRNGFLDYKYLSEPQSSDKGQLYEAFEKAYEFVNRLSLQKGSTRLYLSGINSNNSEYYEITFDYMINDNPVFINLENAGEAGKSLKNAIVIRANSKAVLWCQALLRDFETVGIKKTYNLEYDTFLNTVLQLYKGLDTIPGKEVSVGYMVDSDSIGKQIIPEWVISAQNKYYVVPMPKK